MCGREAFDATLLSGSFTATVVILPSYLMLGVFVNEKRAQMNVSAHLIGPQLPEKSIKSILICDDMIACPVSSPMLATDTDLILFISLLKWFLPNKLSF